MTRKQPMTLQLQQQWRKDGEKRDRERLASALADAAKEHDPNAGRNANH